MVNGIGYGGNGNIANALYMGVQGFNRGLEKVVGASVDLSSANNPNRDKALNAESNLANSAVELISGSLQAEASARVIKAANETLGTIIDTFA